MPRYAIEMPNGRYVRKGDGINDFVRDIKDATWFRTKEEATAAKPGHHRDMGGNGFVGRVFRLSCYVVQEGHNP